VLPPGHLDFELRVPNRGAEQFPIPQF